MSNVHSDAFILFGPAVVRGGPGCPGRHAHRDPGQKDAHKKAAAALKVEITKLAAAK
jgi:hypothetical protein